MAGTFKGRVDILSNNAVQTASFQEVFTNAFQFFQHLASSSYAQLISYYTGSIAAEIPVHGGGTNFHNQPNPFTENAWACFRMPSGSAPDGSVSARASDMYVFFQWAYNNNFNAGKGNPATINGSSTGAAGAGVGIQLAWRDDGLSPWNGTTKNNGEDDKGSPVWTAGTSSLRCFPRSNSTGGSFATNAENCAQMSQQNLLANTPYRYHFIADRDSFFFFIDDADNNSYDRMTILGFIDPIAGLTTGTNGLAPMPIYMFSEGGASSCFISVASTYGDTAGTAAKQGGIVGSQSRMTAPVRGIRNDRYSNNLIGNTSLEPNPQFPSSSLDLFKIPAIVFESSDFGLVGFLNTITETFNANSNSVNSGSTLAVFGTNANQQFVVPWSGSSPGTNSTRNGREF